MPFNRVPFKRRQLCLALACMLPMPALAQHGSSSAVAPVGAGPFKHGDLVVESVWLRQPPDGARVAGGFMRITNTGSTSDRLVSGNAPFAKRFEVHEMAVVDGVMRMRELAKGIEIKPGQTIDLKPGGLHVMFMDLTAPPKAGETRKATLVFERAGTIEIDVAVVPFGKAPAKAHGHH